MSSQLLPFAIVWAVLAIGVLAMIVWRKTIAAHEDDSLHVLSAVAAQQQTGVAHKLDVIDKWGKILTLATVLFGLVVGAAYVYDSFVNASNLGS